jgi:RimJ/RimL family protein N-acetyltransferase
MKIDAQGPVLESERLSMRSLSSADEALYCELYTSAQVMQFVGAPQSRESALDAFRKSLERMNQGEFERRVVVLIDRASQEPIGISSVRLLAGTKGRAEVGTLLKPGAHEKGFGIECSVALITQAFKRPQIKELVAYSAPENAIVDRLLVELGFARDEQMPPKNGLPIRTRWLLTRDAWAKRDSSRKSK